MHVGLKLIAAGAMRDNLRRGKNLSLYKNDFE